MRRSRSLQRLVASLVAVSFCFFSVVVVPVKAAMVGTPEILQLQVDDQARDKVRLFLQRQDVGQYLEAMGVDRQEAQARVDTMTDAEIRMLVNKIDQMPAGGDALGFLLALAVVVFVVFIDYGYHRCYRRLHLHQKAVANPGKSVGRPATGSLSCWFGFPCWPGAL
jgi:hypothetical protein